MLDFCATVLHLWLAGPNVEFNVFLSSLVFDYNTYQASISSSVKQ
jgi:hypothetical protein